MAKRSGTGNRPARSSSGAAHDARRDGPPDESANPWLAAWSGFAEMLHAAAQPSSAPQISVDTARVADLQQHYVEQLAGLWREFLDHPEQARAPIKDNRFADPAWQGNPVASFYARAYLLNADFMNRLADTVETDRKTKRRVKFAVSQFVERCSTAAARA
jgi:polyhydroxyalkanoate synthase